MPPRRPPSVSQLGGDIMRMLGRPSRALAWFMGGLVAVFLLFVFGGASLQLRYLALTPGRVLRGEVWQLLSYMLVHAHPASLLMNLLGLWVFGSMLEREWGTRRFFIFLALTGATAAAAMVGAAALLGPAALADKHVDLAYALGAMVVAFGLLYPRSPIYFLGLVPIEARWLAVGLSALIVLNGLARRAWVDTAGYVLAMGMGALLVSGLWRPRALWAKLKLRFYRRKLKVLDGGARDSRRYLN